MVQIPFLILHANWQVSCSVYIDPECYKNYLCWWRYTWILGRQLKWINRLALYYTSYSCSQSVWNLTSLKSTVVNAIYSLPCSGVVISALCEKCFHLLILKPTGSVFCITLYTKYSSASIFALEVANFRIS